MIRKPYRNILLGRLHKLKSELGIPEQQYRDFLWDNFELTSSADLIDDGILEAICRLKKLANREPASKKIWAAWYRGLCPLLRDREQTTPYLLGIVSQAVGRPLKSANFDLLDDGERWKAIEAIKQRIRQNGGDPMK